MLSLVEGKRKGWGETGKKSIFSTVMLIIINDNSPLIEASFSGKNQARSQPARWGGSELGWVEHRRGYMISWRGWRHSIHKHPPPPWTLSAWRHPPSEKLKNTPTLGHSQAPPPWTLPVWRHPHSKGGDRSRYRDKFKGGGVIIPVTPPPGSATGTLYRVWLGCLYHGRNKESSSNRRGWLISHSGAYFHL